jgi:hypothetical protein
MYAATCTPLARRMHAPHTGCIAFGDGRWRRQSPSRLPLPFRSCRVLQRPEEESVSTDFLRPLQPVDTSWMPTAGDVVELEFMDGWWPVRVKKVDKDGKWHVLYQPLNKVHKVQRDKLRQIVVWDAVTARFHPAGK